MVTQMIAVGEETGRLDQMLTKVANFYDEEVDATLKGLTSLIEPLMIVGLGLIVGFIAVSVISPIYSLVGSLGSERAAANSHSGQAGPASSVGLPACPAWADGHVPAVRRERSLLLDGQHPGTWEPTARGGAGRAAIRQGESQGLVRGVDTLVRAYRETGDTTLETS